VRRRLYRAPLEAALARHRAGRITEGGSQLDDFGRARFGWIEMALAELVHIEVRRISASPAETAVGPQ
jgi:hypothetical protein